MEGVSRCLVTKMGNRESKKLPVQLEPKYLLLTCGWVTVLARPELQFPPAKLYILDMPRAQSKKLLCQLYIALEILQDCKVYDTLYKSRVLRFERPRIIVFTNTPPKTKYLTKDRWNFWTIKDSQLALYECVAELARS